MASMFYEAPTADWGNWAVNSVAKTLRWSFKTIRSSLFNPPIEEDTIYIILENARVIIVLFVKLHTYIM